MPTGKGSAHALPFRSLIFLLLLTVAACRTVAPDEPEPEQASTAQQAWVNLIARREETPAASALVRLHISGTPSLRARISRDANGSVEIDVLTPLGTEAIGIYARPNGDTFVLDEIHQTYWRGTFADVASILHLPDSTAQEFFWLAVGLPAPGEWQMVGASTANEARYQMRLMTGIAAPSGLVEIQLLSDKRGGGSAKIVHYDGTGFPPKKVSFSDSASGAEILRLDVLDFTAGAKIGDPKLTSDWERVDDLSQLFG